MPRLRSVLLTLHGGLLLLSGAGHDKSDHSRACSPEMYLRIVGWNRHLSDSWWQHV